MAEFLQRKMTEAELFFYKNAEAVLEPAVDSDAEDARQSTAKLYAESEAKAKAGGYVFVWTKMDQGSWPRWKVEVFNSAAQIQIALCNVDLGRCETPHEQQTEVRLIQGKLAYLAEL